MFRMSVTYPSSPGATFDVDYYTTVHMPMVRDRFGPLLLKDEMWLGTTALDGGEAPHRVVLHMYFEDRPALDRRFAEVGDEIVADIPNYTNIAAVVQYEDVSG